MTDERLGDADEVLPGQDRPPVRRGVRIAIGLVVVAAAATGAIVLVARDGGETRNSAESSPADLPTNAATVTLDPSTGRTRSALLCDEVASDGSKCAVSIGVPHQVVLAVRSLFPKAEVDASYTITGRTGSVFVRKLAVRAGDTDATVLIDSGSGRYFRVTHRRTRDITRFQTDVQHRHVSVEVTDPAPARRIPRAALERLAADPRLLAAH